MSNLKPIPDFINGFRVVKDLGLIDTGSIKKRRKCIAECMICNAKFSIDVTELRQKKAHKCLNSMEIDLRTKKRLQSIHGGMKERCNNKKNKDFHKYGARGIKVCDEWFRAYEFVVWALNNGYQEDLTIDRVDNNKGYSPENCRWATPQVQSQNTRNTFLTPEIIRLIKIDLLTMSGVDVAIKYGLNRQFISTIKTGKYWCNISI